MNTIRLIIFLMGALCLLSSDTYGNETISVNEGYSIDTLKKDLSWFESKDTIQFQPVCGSNGKTYQNEGEAKFFGIKRWSSGSCQSYQETYSLHPEELWIKEVSLNGMFQQSDYEEQGYTKFTNVIFEVTKGSPNYLSLKPSISNSSEETCIKVWIDFNSNGQFEKSELVISNSAENLPESHSFKLPEYLEIDYLTRMRVFFGGKKEYPESGYIEQGEIEDYTIIVAN